MKKLPSVTIVAVASTQVEATMQAMERSMADIQFAEALFFTDQSIRPRNKSIKVVSIERLDYKGYNHFILYRLKDYVQTGHALVIQHDGYVLRPNKWRDEFLSYDYIGAPWAKDAHFTNDGINVRVGNGGFSLRSKKLLCAPSILGLPFTDSNSGHFNEDGFICLHHRKELEHYGINFAPVSVASLFSCEKRHPDSSPRPFGFHNAPRSRRAKFLLALRGMTIDIRILIRKSLQKFIHFYRHRLKITRRNISALKNQLAPHKHISEYRKKIQVYDVFTLFNELDLLEIRLNILDPYVDYFVIVEATETFSGKQKPLYYAKNKERFKKWEHKIIHWITDNIPADEHDARRRLEENENINELEKRILNGALTNDSVGRDRDGNLLIHWFKEFYQKESIQKALTKLSDDDICYVSDVDEIWDPEAKIDFTKDHVYKLKQWMYTYYLNNRTSEPWIGPIVAKYKIIKNSCLNNLRTERKTDYVYVNNGGWHFTNVGGADQIRMKLASYGHQEYNIPKITAALEENIKRNKDFIGRKFKMWVEEKNLPAYILNNKEKYKTLFR